MRSSLRRRPRPARLLAALAGVALLLGLLAVHAGGAHAAPAPVWGAYAADAAFSNALPGSPATPVSAGNLARTWSVGASLGAARGCRAARVPPVASAASVVATSGTRVRALSPANGATLWTRDLADPATSVVVATATANGRVVSVVLTCATQAVAVLALDTGTGAVLARRTGLPARDAQVATAPGLLLAAGSVVLNDRVLDAATLADRWRLPTGAAAATAWPRLVSAGRVYVRYGALDAAPAGTGEIRDLATGAVQRTVAAWSQLPSLAAADGTYGVRYRAGASPELAAYDPATGTSRTLVPTGLTGWLPAVSGDDVVAPCANAPLKVCRYDRSGARRATSAAFGQVPSRVLLTGEVVLVTWSGGQGAGATRGTQVLRRGDLAPVVRLGQVDDLEAAVPIGTRLLTTTGDRSRLVMLAP